MVFGFIFVHFFVILLATQWSTFNGSHFQCLLVLRTVCICLLFSLFFWEKKEAGTSFLHPLKCWSPIDDVKNHGTKTNKKKLKKNNHGLGLSSFLSVLILILRHHHWVPTMINKNSDLPYFLISTSLSPQHSYSQDVFNYNCTKAIP